jgi:hypothetical protein
MSLRSWWVARRIRRQWALRVRAPSHLLQSGLAPLFDPPKPSGPAGAKSIGASGSGPWRPPGFLRGLSLLLARCLQPLRQALGPSLVRFRRRLVLRALSHGTRLLLHRYSRK